MSKELVGEAARPGSGAASRNFIPVAQIFNLLYRRIVFCWALATTAALGVANVLPIEN